MKDLLHIGTIELVSFPNDRINDVPVKIDTGADSSAIWASNIRINDGKLSFNFFAPGSAYYREMPVVTTAFKTISVKNSFGQNETRYKIRLKVQIGKYKLTRWFSLADRSRNTYPVLLGKNFLRGRFIVDVSNKFLISKGALRQTVLVLGATKSTEFFDQVSRSNAVVVDYHCAGYDELIFSIDGLSTRVISDGSEARDIADFTLTYFKSHNQNMEFALAAACYLHFKGKPFIDHELRSFVSLSKLTESLKLATYDLPVPLSICAKTRILLSRYEELAERLGSPFVLKEISSDQGKNNYFISKVSDFRKVLKDAPDEQTFMAQKYIENDGFLRVYVTGKEASLAVQRTPSKHANPLKVHLNKPAGSANASIVETGALPLEVKELAVNAATCMERQIAGVDLIKDKQSGKWYILEVNNGPQLRSGSYIDEKVRMMAKYFDKELER